MTDDIESKYEINDSLIRLYAQDDDSKTFITGISDEFEKHVDNKLDLNVDELFEELNLSFDFENDEKLKEFKKEFYRIFPSYFIKSYAFKSNIKDFQDKKYEQMNNSIHKLQTESLHELISLFIKITHYRQLLFENTITVSETGDIVRINKANNFKWIIHPNNP